MDVNIKKNFAKCMLGRGGLIGLSKQKNAGVLCYAEKFGYFPRAKIWNIAVFFTDYPLVLHLEFSFAVLMEAIKILFTSTHLTYIFNIQ